MEDINKIIGKEPVHPDKQPYGIYELKKRKKRKNHKDAKKYLAELTKIVDETHQELEEKNSPFRLCVYQEGDDIFIDIVTIDETGKIEQVFKHDISHSELANLIAHIKTGRGLLLDADV